ncbi:MAG: histidine kinase [Chloroflexi bacterium]|nr:MAG: histidine kinase [Chloroflexota bacterium]
MEANSIRIKELEERIADLKARLPKHSVRAAMIIELEDLEEELEQAQAAQQKGEQ